MEIVIDKLELHSNCSYIKFTVLNVPPKVDILIPEEFSIINDNIYNYCSKVNINTNGSILLMFKEPFNVSFLIQGKVLTQPFTILSRSNCNNTNNNNYVFNITNWENCSDVITNTWYAFGIIKKGSITLLQKKFSVIFWLQNTLICGVNFYYDNIDTMKELHLLGIWVRRIRNLIIKKWMIEQELNNITIKKQIQDVVIYENLKIKGSIHRVPSKINGCLSKFNRDTRRFIVHILDGIFGSDKYHPFLVYLVQYEILGRDAEGLIMDIYEDYKLCDYIDYSIYDLLSLDNLHNIMMLDNNIIGINNIKRSKLFSKNVRDIVLSFMCKNKTIGCSLFGNNELGLGFGRNIKNGLDRRKRIPHLVVNVISNSSDISHIQVVKITIEQVNGKWFTGFIPSILNEKSGRHYKYFSVVNGSGCHEFIPRGRKTNQHTKKRNRGMGSLLNEISSKKYSLLNYIEWNPDGLLPCYIEIREDICSSFRKLNDKDVSLWTKLMTLETLIKSSLQPTHTSNINTQNLYWCKSEIRIRLLIQFFKTFDFNLDCKGCNSVLMKPLCRYLFNNESFDKYIKHSNGFKLDLGLDGYYIENTHLNLAVGLFQMASRNYTLRMILMECISSYKIKKNTRLDKSVLPMPPINITKVFCTVLSEIGLCILYTKRLELEKHLTKCINIFYDTNKNILDTYIENRKYNKCNQHIDKKHIYRILFINKLLNY